MLLEVHGEKRIVLYVQIGTRLVFTVDVIEACDYNISYNKVSRASPR